MSDLHPLLRDLYAIPGRSVAGPANRRTYDRLGEEIELRRLSVPSGSAVFDWTVPQEWHLRRASLHGYDARLEAACPEYPYENLVGIDLGLVDAERPHQVDLGVVTHSVAVNGRYDLGDLSPHLHTHPTLPDATPYVYSHHRPGWGFCLPRRVREAMKGSYDVEIDADHVDGVMDLAEHTLPGSGDGVVIFSAHCCHPQLANDNWAAVAVLARLAQELARWPGRRHTYRFVFAPGTVGTLAWLMLERPANVVGGLVLSAAGGPGPGGGVTFKLPKHAGTPTEQVMRPLAADVREFEPTGYDERQFSSPGFDLPVGRLSRTPGGEYLQYHSSADDLDFVTEVQMQDTLDHLLAFCDGIERHDPPPPRTLGEGLRRNEPHGELQLGKHGLYADPAVRHAALWVLNLADGHHTERQISDRAGLDLATVERTVALCRERGLIVR